MNYWKKGCAYLLKNDPVFKRYYNPKHQLRTNKNKFQIKKSAFDSKSHQKISSDDYSSKIT